MGVDGRRCDLKGWATLLFPIMLLAAPAITASGGAAIVAGQAGGVGYGLGIAQFAPGILGHDGQLPGYSTFMVYNTNTNETIIIGANLSASPVDGETAAVVVAKSIIAELYGAADVPKNNPAAPPTTPAG